jgi:hypothetical protein
MSNAALEILHKTVMDKNKAKRQLFPDIALADGKH